MRAHRRDHGGVSDEELLRMLQAVEDVPQPLVLDEEEPLPSERLADADPCPFCGEPAENRGECHACSEEGCLPPDLWTPGQADPCLTLCVRCARTIHVGCAREDAAGNPACPTCKF